MQMHEHARFAMAPRLRLISHKLCPYVQRAVIALTEKGVGFERIDIDLANKPDWFVAISPLGKTPVLQVGDVAIFESAVILEYLEETQPSPLHPADPLKRAEHRAWIEFGSAVLNDIAGFYAAPDEVAFKTKTSQLEQRFARLEARVAAAPWFDGENFSLVDHDALLGLELLDQRVDILGRHHGVFLAMHDQARRRAGRQEREIIEIGGRRDRNKTFDLGPAHQQLHADPGAERKSRDPAGTRLRIDSLRPIQRGSRVRKFAGAVIERSLAAANAAKIEAQHRKSPMRERVVALVDDLMVHRAVKLRMRVQD